MYPIARVLLIGYTRICIAHIDFPTKRRRGLEVSRAKVIINSTTKDFSIAD
jgi:hypothetical protein